jgi:hypothetical protein
MPSSSRVLPVPCASGCSARRNPRGRKLVPVYGHRYLGATLGVSDCMGFPIAPSTTMATHPLSYTLPVDVVKSVVTLRTNRSGWCFCRCHLNTISRRRIDPFPSHLQRLCTLRWGTKSDSAREPSDIRTPPRAGPRWPEIYPSFSLALLLHGITQVAGGSQRRVAP